MFDRVLQIAEEMKKPKKKNSNFSSWYDNQNETTKAWLDSQPIWNDKDMWVALFIGITIGFLVGLFF